LHQVAIDGSAFPVSRVAVSVLGGEYEVGLRLASTDIPTFSQIFVRNEYESANLPENARVIIDLGANVGYATVYFAQKYKDAKILAVEPEAESFRMLEDNVRALGSRVTTLQAAVWHEDGEINLHTDAEDGAPLGA
jgi:tRNA G46 methylase TrmB